MNHRNKLKRKTSVFDIPIPKGCDRVDENNPLAHIYLMAYYQSSWLGKDTPSLERFEIDYNPQEGLIKRRFIKKEEK